ncbi:PREDICTED: uncharacterized protein LOC106818115 [Priapulus caudatus]|uniref:Uncharacterized protein LOC106818115 n=1 Tax=Priapulus caudatus TaxID=37621 RepID=A0ABM1F1K1_PRICU|nr:PREDICTED: uncharacterized protein LOC106818115 [Priapulus caudatus]
MESGKKLTRNDRLMLGGDGRCDSPGHSAKYCTYSLMDLNTKFLIDFSLVQVTQAGNSMRMEKLGLQNCIKSVESGGLEIDILATDRHVQIASMMKKEPEYQHINHQFDVWHLAKSISKKLLRTAKRKECEGLLPWIKSIKNHLWWSSATCNGDSKLLKDKWTSILCHVSNVHCWIPKLTSLCKCAHEPLNEKDVHEIMWLTVGSPPYEALKNVVLNKRLLNDTDDPSFLVDDSTDDDSDSASDSEDESDHRPSKVA